MWAITGDIYNVTVLIARRLVEFSQGTMKMKEQMTHRIQTVFLEAYRRASDDESDDDDEFADQNETLRARKNA